MRRFPTYAVMAAAVTITVAGCGGSGTHSASQAPTASAPAPSSAAPAAAGATTVNIANYAYQPSAATVKVGTKVTFTNHDGTAHTATAAGPPGFDTGSIMPGRRASVILAKPGTYSYICQFHPFMKATITVS